jgi:hypothetical protein
LPVYGPSVASGKDEVVVADILMDHQLRACKVRSALGQGRERPTAEQEEVTTRRRGVPYQGGHRRVDIHMATMSEGGGYLSYAMESLSSVFGGTSNHRTRR